MSLGDFQIEISDEINSDEEVMSMHNMTEEE